MKKVFVTLLLILITMVAVAQDIPELSVATDFYTSGELDSALQAVTEILKEHPKDAQALRLKAAIEKDLAVNHSSDLTNDALLFIDQSQFSNAKELLRQALLANPNNELAMDLYVSLSHIDLAEAAQVQVDDTKIVSATAIPNERNEEPTATTVVSATTEATDSDTTTTTTLPVSEEDSTTGSSEKPESEKKEKSGNSIPFGFSAGPRITFANSNQLTIDSKATLLGLEADAWMYLPIWDSRIGFQAGYAGDFIAMSSAEGVNFTSHRFVGSALLRTWLFDDETYRTTLGGSLNYNWFINQNKELEGAYLIREFIGPGFGFFIEDPIIARFADGDFSRNLSFRFSTDTYFSSGPSGLLTGLDLDVGAKFNFGPMGVALGYDLFALFLDGTRESYNSIYIKAVVDY